MTSPRHAGSTKEFLNDNRTSPAFHSLDYLSPFDSTTERVYATSNNLDRRHEVSSLANTLSGRHDKGASGSVIKKSSSSATRGGGGGAAKMDGLWQPVHTLPYNFTTSPRRSSQNFNFNNDEHQNFYQITE